MDNDLSKYTITDLSTFLRDKKVDALELFEYFFEKIKSYKDKNIFISMNEDRSRFEAEKSSKRYKEDNFLGPLDGIPMSWKDLIDIKGYKTTSGSLIHKQIKPAKKDAKIVSNCSKVGMIVLGKLNLTEFAFSGVGINPHYGTPKNSFSKNKDYIPGGSSSASAVSVAAGLSPVSIGTDTGGSVRIPASMNGLIGYKSSEGHINKELVRKLSHTLDTIGPLGKCVDDCILIERALRGSHIVLPRAADLYDIQFIVPKNYIFDEASEQVLENFENCLSALSRKGLKVKREYIKELDEMYESSKKFGTIVTAEAFYNLNTFLDSESRDLIDERVIDRVELGRHQTAFDYINIVEKRKELNLKIKKLFENNNFLIMPTVACNTPEIEKLNSSKDEFHKINSLILRNTMIGNYFNLPGITFPSGLDINGVPTGILLSAYSNQDEKLLCYARSIEKILEENFKL